MSGRYEHPAEFSLAEIAWIVDGAYAEDLGAALDRSTVHAARQKWARVVRAGGMTMTEADRFATRLGYHPANLWENWFVRCAELDDRHAEWEANRKRQRNDRIRDRKRLRRADAAAQVAVDQMLAEHVEWVRWCDRREHRRWLAEEIAAR